MRCGSFVLPRQGVAIIGRVALTGAPTTGVAIIGRVALLGHPLGAPKDLRSRRMGFRRWAYALHLRRIPIPRRAVEDDEIT